MGHTLVPDTNDALYGFKTELKEQLRNRNLPQWVSTDYIHVRAKHEDITLDEAFDMAAEEARQIREDFNTDNPTWDIELPLDTGSGFMGGRNRVPDKIWNNLSITEKQAQDYTGFHHVSPRDYRLVVKVGSRGGIKDLYIARDFHH